MVRFEAEATTTAASTNDMCRETLGTAIRAADAATAGCCIHYGGGRRRRAPETSHGDSSRRAHRRTWLRSTPPSPGVGHGPAAIRDATRAVTPLYHHAAPCNK